jgi:hypothetical protein
VKTPKNIVASWHDPREGSASQLALTKDDKLYRRENHGFRADDGWSFEGRFSGPEDVEVRFNERYAQGRFERDPDPVKVPTKTEIREYVRRSKIAAGAIQRLLDNEKRWTTDDTIPLSREELKASLAEWAVELSGTASEVQNLIEARYGKEVD